MEMQFLLGNEVKSKILTIVLLPGADTRRTGNDILKEVCDPCLSIVGQLFLGA